MKQSKELTRFYKEINDWINKGCLWHPIFNPRKGLCVSLHYWLMPVVQDASLCIEIQKELHNSFKEAGLDAVCPFNDGDLCRTLAESWAGETYNNTKRLAWIREHQ